MKEIDKDTAFRITPKGALSALLLEQVPGIGVWEAATICEKFEAKMKERADVDEIRGIPCIVLKDGWHLVAVKELMKE